MLDIQRSDLVAGVAGSGTMGRGIVQVLAQCGVRTLVFDAKPGAAQKAKDAIGKTLASLVQKGRMAQADADAGARRASRSSMRSPRSSPATSWSRRSSSSWSRSRNCSGRSRRSVARHCILASNTSSLSVTAMASACAKPGRVAGYHFFNPVPLMKIVEVVDGVLTEPWVGDALVALAKRYGHKPVRCKDTPGFIVNHAGRGYVPESAARAAGRRRRFRHHRPHPGRRGGFRIGPFALLDLVGLDVAHGVMKSMHAQYYGEPNTSPPPRRAARRGGTARAQDRPRLVQYGKDGIAEKIPEQPVPAAKAALGLGACPN